MLAEGGRAWNADLRLLRRPCRYGRRPFVWTGRQAWGAIRPGLVDLRGLPRGTQVLLIAGYVVVLLCLALVLLLELFPEMRSRLPQIQPGLLAMSTTSLDMRYIPTSGPFGWLPSPLGVRLGGRVDGTIPLLLVAALACFVGWGLVLTGASDCGRRVFVPLVALFGIHLQVLTGFLGNPSALGLVTIAGGFLGFSATDHPEPASRSRYWRSSWWRYRPEPHLLTHRSSRWRDHPLLEFLFWTLVGPLLIVAIVLSMPGIPVEVRPGLLFPLAVEFTYLSAIGGAWIGMLLAVFFGSTRSTLASSWARASPTTSTADGASTFTWVAAALTILAAVAALMVYIATGELPPICSTRASCSCSECSSCRLSSSPAGQCGAC